MSDKWRRSKAWDDANIPPALWPVKVVLRALSSIWLAVCLLILVSIYGALASVPIGLVVYGLTYLVYGLTIMAAVAVGAGVPLWILARVLRGASDPARFGAMVAMGLVLVPASIAAWYRLAWPSLVYDPATGEGLKLFAGFVERYRSVTLRRLPGLEMSELEFYAWWPLRVVLLLFMVNMVTATVRRIEFTFKNIGVLTVHTGIVTIALGSIYYAGLKLEGDMILRAGMPDPATGRATMGPAEDRFYDNLRSALYIEQDRRGWEARVLDGVPRYNEYNLSAGSRESVLVATGQRQPWLDADLRRELDVPVVQSTLGLVDPDIRFRLVGYAPYAEPVEDWVRIEPPRARLMEADLGDPLRVVNLFSNLPDADGRRPASTEAEKQALRPAFAFTMIPTIPKERIVAVAGVLGVEYTLGSRAGMPPERWRDLTEPLPENTGYGLVVEVPGAGGGTAGGSGFRAAYAVEPGSKIRVGSTGYSITVKELADQPPFPIITKGYEGSTSSVATLTITTPTGESYERWVYHRFPEIAQDILGEQPDGRPSRRDADAAIRISLIDATKMQVFFDEPDATGRARAAIRLPGGGVRVIEDVSDAIVPFDENVWLRRGLSWDHAVRIDRPRPVPEEERTDRQAIGTHEKAMLAVEVSIVPEGARGADRDEPVWSKTVWLPFARYFSLRGETARRVVLPDGRRLELCFSRQQHRLPGFEVALVDFEMIAYDHRGAPRDYQSIVHVSPAANPRPGDFSAFTHVTKLNAPLRAPFHWSEDRLWIVNVLGRLASGLNPHQFKFAQSGWDAGGWEESQALADQGLTDRPRARFTILGVGNNPGIHIIALGSVLMGMGIPWAFYVKPWLVQREKKRIQALYLQGAFVPPKARRDGPGQSAAGTGDGGATGAGTPDASAHASANPQTVSKSEEVRS